MITFFNTFISHKDYFQANSTFKSYEKTKINDRTLKYHKHRRVITSIKLSSKLRLTIVNPRLMLPVIGGPCWLIDGALIKEFKLNWSISGASEGCLDDHVTEN